jgi:hypothetical protein
MPGFALAQSGTDSFVDINSYSLAAIERIEILGEWASAIYGSDAYRRRGEYHHSEPGRQHGGIRSVTEKPPGRTTRMTRHESIVTGMNKERFRWMFAADYFQQNRCSAGS